MMDGSHCVASLKVAPRANAQWTRTSQAGIHLAEAKGRLSCHLWVGWFSDRPTRTLHPSPAANGSGARRGAREWRVVHRYAARRGVSHRGGAGRPTDEMGQHVIVAKLSHGGVALYESSTSRLLRWLLMTSGTATAAQVDGDEVIVAFADGQQGIFDRDTGDLKRMGVATPATPADR